MKLLTTSLSAACLTDDTKTDLKFYNHAIFSLSHFNKIGMKNKHFNTFIFKCCLYFQEILKKTIKKLFNYFVVIRETVNFKDRLTGSKIGCFK